MNSLSILVPTPDSYFDVYEVFRKCFKANWNDCPYPLYVVTDTKEYVGVNLLQTMKTDSTWHDRVLYALDYIQSEYILLLCDDIFVLRKINNDEIDYIVSDMRKYGILYCGMNNNITGPILHPGSMLVKVRKNQAYGKNLQAGIFKKSYLISLLEGNQKTAYDIEMEWLREAEVEDNSFDEQVVSCKKNILHCIEGVGSGKWDPFAVKKLRKVGVEIDSMRGIEKKSRMLYLYLVKALGKKMPPKTRKIIKKCLSKIGFRFVTDN